MKTKRFSTDSKDKTETIRFKSINIDSEIKSIKYFKQQSNKIQTLTNKIQPRFY